MPDRFSNTSSTAASNNSKRCVSINCGLGFKHFYILIHLILTTVICSRNHYSLHFINEKTGTEVKSDLPKGTQFVSDGAGIQTQSGFRVHAVNP